MPRSVTGLKVAINIINIRLKLVILVHMEKHEYYVYVSTGNLIESYPGLFHLYGYTAFCKCWYNILFTPLCLFPINIIMVFLNQVTFKIPINLPPKYCVCEVILTYDPWSSTPQSPAGLGAILRPDIGPWVRTINRTPE